jgi:hypothetical protein
VFTKFDSLPSKVKISDRDCCKGSIVARNSPFSWAISSADNFLRLGKTSRMVETNSSALVATPLDKPIHGWTYPGSEKRIAATKMMVKE